MSGDKKILFKSEEIKTVDQVAEALRLLADKIANKQEISLDNGNEKVGFTVPDSVEFELKFKEKAKRDGVKTSFEIELEWGPDSKGGSVSIS